MTDTQLLQQFLQGSHEAFAQVVHRHVHWVYSCARRQVRDGHQADDITQAVFLLLSRKAAKLTATGNLSPWLFQAVRYISKSAMKSESRRKNREIKAASMKTELMIDPSWDDVSEVLDESVAHLPGKDRQAVLLRFYEQKSLAEVGVAMNCSEEAARKRIGRALGSLRVHLQKRGVSSSVASLAPILLAHAGGSAPAHLIAGVGSITSTSSTSTTSILARQGMSLIGLAKAKLAAGVIGSLILISAAVPIVSKAVSGSEAAQSPAVSVAPSTNSSSIVEVKTVDRDGKPVAGAEVFLQVTVYPPGEPSRYALLGPVLTDAAGLARFSAPTMRASDSHIVYARVAGKSVGIRNGVEDHPQVVLAESKTIKGALTVPADFKANDAKIRILSLNVRRGSWFDESPSLEIDETTRALFTYPVAADGTFEIPDAPLNGTLVIAANAPGLGEAQVRMKPNSPAVKFDLKKEGILEGTVSDAGGKPAPDVTMYATSFDIASSLASNRPFIAKTDSAGRFRIAGLPDDAFVLAGPCNEGIGEWILPPRESIRVRAGQTISDIHMQFTTGAIVTGKVVDAASGAPLSGANVSAINPSRTGANRIGWMRTDDAGVYRLRVPVGVSRIHLSGAPGGYASPRRGGEMKVEIAERETEKEGPTFKLSPQKAAAPASSTVQGRVVDADGKPMKGLTIGDYWMSPVPGEVPTTLSDDHAALTGEDGAFVMQVPAGGKHLIYVASEQWSREKKNITPKTGETVQLGDLVVKPRPVIGELSGKIVDDQGKPIPNARVGFPSDEMATDSEGRFKVALRDRRPSMIFVRAVGYTIRSWDDIPFDAKDLTFTLYPMDKASRSPDDNVIKAADVIDKAAPELTIEKWVNLPQKPPPKLTGQWTCLMFTFDTDPKTAAAIQALEFEARRAGAQAIVLASPAAHESSLMARFKDAHVNIGIDQIDITHYFATDGATFKQYGASRANCVFLIDPMGIVRAVRSTPKGLGDLIGQQL